MKRETHGQREGRITLLHVWAMEESTRLFLLVEVAVMKLMRTYGYWTHSQEEWRRWGELSV